MINSDNQKFSEIRFDWERDEILEILNYPLIDLMWEAQIIHRRFNQYKVQLASLFSVKTGGCQENCSYCSQSIYSSSQIKSHPQFEVEAVLNRAKAAKKEGADRFCMGWAWREIRDGKPFNSMIEMVVRKNIDIVTGPQISKSKNIFLRKCFFSKTHYI